MARPVMRNVTITDFQWIEIVKALKKRLQHLRGGARRYGQDNLQKTIAIEAILNAAVAIDYCLCCGQGDGGCVACDPVGPWCPTCSCQH